MCKMCTTYDGGFYSTCKECREVVWEQVACVQSPLGVSHDSVQPDYLLICQERYQHSMT